MLRTIITAAMVCAAGTAFADARADAIREGAADCITTGAGLAFGGLTEANPAGPLASCVLKGVLIGMASDLPEPQRTTAFHAANAAWGGAAVNNVFAMVGAGTAAPVFGLFVAVGLWAAGQEERAFMHECAIHQQLAGHALTCNYERPKR